MDWKTPVLRMFLKMGYGIYKIGRGDEYNLCPPHEYRTYAPWYEGWFQEIYDRIRANVICREDHCYVIQNFTKHCSLFEGDFAECGVYKGGTAFLIADTLVNNSVQERKLHLFDTFAGMPATAKEDPSGMKEGQLGDTSLSAVEEYLKKFPFIVFHPGLIPETFEVVKDRKFAFVHIDVDLYQTSKDCCNFFYDRLIPGGVMIFDDYGMLYFKDSEKRAVDEFFSDKPESPIALHTGQCIIIKL